MKKNIYFLFFLTLFFSTSTFSIDLDELMINLINQTSQEGVEEAYAAFSLPNYSIENQDKFKFRNSKLNDDYLPFIYEIEFQRLVSIYRIKYVAVKNDVYSIEDEKIRMLLEDLEARYNKLNSALMQSDLGKQLKDILADEYKFQMKLIEERRINKYNSKDNLISKITEEAKKIDALLTKLNNAFTPAGLEEILKITIDLVLHCPQKDCLFVGIGASPTILIDYLDLLGFETDYVFMSQTPKMIPVNALSGVDAKLLNQMRPRYNSVLNKIKSKKIRSVVFVDFVISAGSLVTLSNAFKVISKEDPEIDQNIAISAVGITRKEISYFKNVSSSLSEKVNFHKVDLKGHLVFDEFFFLSRQPRKMSLALSNIRSGAADDFTLMMDLFSNRTEFRKIYLEKLKAYIAEYRNNYFKDSQLKSNGSVMQMTLDLLLSCQKGFKARQ